MGTKRLIEKETLKEKRQWAINDEKKMLKKKLTREQMEGIEMFDRNRKRLGVGGDEEEELPEDPELLKIERITPFQHLNRLKKTVAQETKTFAAPARNYMKQLHSKRVSDKIARKEEEAKERTRLRIAREERSLAKTRERTGWVKDFVKQLVGVALIVVKEHERNASI